MNYKKEIEEKVNKALNLLTTVDFYSKEHRILNSNQEKIHKAYNLLFDIRDILKYSL